MTKTSNIYDLKNTSVEVQLEMFITIISNSVISENGVFVFDANLLLANENTKSLVKFTPLIEKTKKLVEMVNNDYSLMERDLQTDLWFLL